MSFMLAYHYTNSNNAPLIAKAGLLQVSPFYLFPGERAALHATLSPTWEPTAHRTYGERYRIVLPAELVPLDWRQYVERSGIPRKFARRLQGIAYESGSPIKQWRHSFAPIESSDWIGFERLNEETGLWEPWNH